uniref:Phospholipase-like protein n=1 Tax=Tanacetum cinerariifolium TaxID=118510 RepID=A0A699IUS1_TANCI|nr:phospholipase-like protein [Tanacetum cinerariifolium]
MPSKSATEVKGKCKRSNKQANGSKGVFSGRIESSFVASAKLLSSTEFSLSSSDLFSSNTSATLLEMEKIMTMIIGESKELALDLEALIIATLDKIDSPVCWQLGEKVLLNCACKRYNIFIPDMEAKETIPSTSETSNLRNDTNS